MSLLSVVESEQESKFDDVAAKRANVSKVNPQNFSRQLDNDEIKVSLDPSTLLPNQIVFKKLNQTLDFEMSLVHYHSEYSLSGAYIFAPYTEAMPLVLKITDA